MVKSMATSSRVAAVALLLLVIQCAYTASAEEEESGRLLVPTLNKIKKKPQESANEEVEGDDGADVDYEEDRHHLPSLPSLPSLAHIHLPVLHHHQHHHHHKETPIITVTETIVEEVTKVIPRPPVCMVVRGTKLPCQLYGQNYKYEDVNDELVDYDMSAEDLPIEPSESLRILHTSAGPFEGFSGQEYLAQEYRQDDDLNLEPSLDSSDRTAKYLEIHRATPADNISADNVTTKSIDQRNDTLTQEERVFFKHKMTVTETRKIRVTKVQEVSDNRITATLEVKNCIPMYSDIPFCRPPKPINPVVPYPRPPPQLFIPVIPRPPSPGHHPHPGSYSTGGSSHKPGIHKPIPFIPFLGFSHLTHPLNLVTSSLHKPHQHSQGPKEDVKPVKEDGADDKEDVGVTDDDLVDYSSKIVPSDTSAEPDVDSGTESA